MLVKLTAHLAVRAKKLRCCFYVGAFTSCNALRGIRLTALLPLGSIGWQKKCHQNAHLFIFTPPDAAVRFADGARKSFSIATCLVQDLETGLVMDSPDGEQKRPPVFRLERCPDKRWQ